MMGGLGMGLYMLLPLLFLIGIVVLIVWATDRGGSARGSREGEGSHMQGRSAEEILKERFTRGEIDIEEYEERQRIMREEFPAARR